MQIAVEGSVSVSLTSGQCPVATVIYSTWETWQNNATGQTEQRNGSSGPAIGASVSWSVNSGDAVLSAFSSNTDSGGNAEASCAPGTTDSTIQVSVGFAGYVGSASMSLSGTGAGSGGGSETGTGSESGTGSGSETGTGTDSGTGSESGSGTSSGSGPGSSSMDFDLLGVVEYEEVLEISPGSWTLDGTIPLPFTNLYKEVWTRVIATTYQKYKIEMWRWKQKDATDWETLPYIKMTPGSTETINSWEVELR